MRNALCPPTALSGLCLILAASSSAALAQTLDEVVVSASRSAQRSFDAPAAVQSVARETIQAAGPQVNLSESLNRVPGLTILDRQNYAQDLQVSIRGFGARSAFGLRGIRLLIDGIPATTPDGQGQASSVSLTSTDHIEVLRGPMALLYGNSSGGVIQAFSKAAPKEAELGYQYYVGSYGLHRANYQFGDTVGTVGILADYSTMTIDGYRANSFTERKQFNGKLGFDLNEQLHVKLVFNQFDMPLARDPLGLTRAQLIADPSQAGKDAAGKDASKYQVRKTVLQNQLGSSATYSLDSDRSLSARAYYGTRDNLQFQAGGSPGPNLDGAWTGLNRAYFGVGLQYNQHAVWSGMPVDWAAGYEFDRSREFRQSGPAKLGQKTDTRRSEDNQSENSDLFAQGSALVSDKVSLTAGLRSSSVRFSSDDYYITATDPNGSGSVSYQATSPVLGVTYHASDALNLYANYGKGFETPTLAEMAYQSNGATAVTGRFNTGLSASSSQHYELGTKWVPGPATRVDLALYQIDTSDELVVAISSSGQTSYKNAPGTSRSGWELSGSQQFTPHLAFNASASMIDAHYSQAFVNRTVVNNVPKDATVASGNKLPGIPQSFLFSELAWTSEPAATARNGLRLGVELVQAGRIYANDANTESADGHTVLNLSASQRWAVGRGGLTAYARLNNLSDERYVGSVIVNQSSAQYYEPGLPQNWTLGLSLNLPL